MHLCQGDMAGMKIFEDYSDYGSMDEGRWGTGTIRYDIEIYGKLPGEHTFQDLFDQLSSCQSSLRRSSPVPKSPATSTALLIVYFGVNFTDWMPSRQRSPIQSPLDFDPWISMDIHGHEEPTLCLTQLQAIISNLFQDISMVFCGTGSSFAGGAGDSFGCRAQDVWRDLGPGIWNWWRHGRRGKRQWYRMEAASKAGDFMVICQYVNLKHAQSRVVF